METTGEPPEIMFTMVAVSGTNRQGRLMGAQTEDEDEELTPVGLHSYERLEGMDRTNFPQYLRKFYQQLLEGGEWVEAHGFFQFSRASFNVDCRFHHPQLRHLVWATTNHDVFFMSGSGVTHWDSHRRKRTRILTESLENDSIMTIAAKETLVLVGGRNGEVVARDVASNRDIFCGYITQEANAIVNTLDIFSPRSGSTCAMSCCNDQTLRLFDCEGFREFRRLNFEFAVNHASRRPQTNVFCVAGDAEDILIVDSDSGRHLHRLQGHQDYSFATSWHKDGYLFATGNQDFTCRIWDLRNLRNSLVVLPSKREAVRSVAFSTDGAFLFMAEAGSSVHIFDVRGGTFPSRQELQLFGEISGISCSPDSGRLFVGVSGQTGTHLGSCLLEFDRKMCHLAGALSCP
uniref:DUF2415 domain-containing protein n=1 Tax=Compsopogon caeruleus TaxID=31354 RepID=A0A7S1XGZ3_9RHOD|mmetsp:Transcript_7844/g.15793  ORF Transcript_7844/g.15793 Transcript_7844/m.15793 type:complete len:403 (+) Transcript_7844:293-1501(+)